VNALPPGVFTESKFLGHGVLLSLVFQWFWVRE
jgi:hypothetical protein